MFSQGTVIAMIAVADLQQAKEFYGTVLGLEAKAENPAGVEYASGGGHVFVYQSQAAGSGDATAAAWKVDDIARAVAELKAKGIAFEQYEIPGAKYEDDVAIMGPMKAAWFKDPDGNTLGLTQSS